MIVYPPIFYSAELKLAFKGRLTWKVADTLQYTTHDVSLQNFASSTTSTYQCHNYRRNNRRSTFPFLSACCGRLPCTAHTLQFGE